MASAAAILTRVREYVYSAQLPEHPFYHQINGAMADTTTGTIIVDEGANFAAGDVVEFQLAGSEEQCLVLSKSSHTLTVMRGFNGTTAATHLDNAIICKNPRFTVKQMNAAVAGVLNELQGHGIHAWGTGTVTRVSQQDLYDLADTDIMNEVGVVSVFHEDSVSIVPNVLPFKFHFYPTALSTGGYVLRLWEWGDQAIGDAVRYVYAKVIDATTDLLVRQEELVVLGAVGRLLAGTMAPRTLDPGKLTDNSIQPGQGSRDARWFQSEFYLMAKREVAVLRNEQETYPQTMGSAKARRWRP